MPPCFYWRHAQCRKLIVSLNVAQLLNTINILKGSGVVDSEKPVETVVEPGVTTETIEHGGSVERSKKTESKEPKLTVDQSDTDSDISSLEDNAADLPTITVSTKALSSP